MPFILRHFIFRIYSDFAYRAINIYLRSFQLETNVLMSTHNLGERAQIFDCLHDTNNQIFISMVKWTFRIKYRQRIVLVDRMKINQCLFKSNLIIANDITKLIIAWNILAWSFILVAICDSKFRKCYIIIQ